MPVDAARFVVREYRSGDETEILAMFARAFPHAPRGIEHFRWKYLNNPAGNRRISVTFDEDGRLVGHYAGYPVRFTMRGGDVVANQIGDTMTEPSIRHVGRGPTSILGRTALHYYETFCAGKVAFNYGFNVANIQKFSLRFLKSDRVEPVIWRGRDLLAHPLDPLPKLERRLAGYQLELVRETGAEWDAFFKRVAGSYGFLVRRDAAWVRWRYLQCPDTTYHVVAIRKWGHLVGWIAYRLDGHRFLWGDALFDREFPDAVPALLRHVVPPQIERIEGWFPQRPQWFDQILRDLKLPPAAEPQDLSLMCVPFVQGDAVEQMRTGLYYSWGDGDLF